MMKQVSLMLAILAILTLPAVSGCATERTYIQPVEKREIHAGPKPKDFDSKNFGQPKVKRHRRRR